MNLEGDGIRALGKLSGAHLPTDKYAEFTANIGDLADETNFILKFRTVPYYIIRILL